MPHVKSELFAVYHFLGKRGTKPRNPSDQTDGSILTWSPDLLTQRTMHRSHILINISSPQKERVKDMG